MKINLQYFGGRGSSSGGGLKTSFPSGMGGGSAPKGMDAQPGMEPTTEAALGTRGRAMGVTAAVQGANPFYDMGAEYQYNCQRCVVATEARMRGYDVEALPTFDNDKMPSNGGYLTNFVDPNPVRISGSSGKRIQTQVENEMANYGDGSRAILRVGWRGGGSGHVLNVVQRNGKTQYYDGQNGTRVDATALFGAISTSQPTVVTRVDNLAFSSTANAAVRPRRK